ncbi:hypothetical protein P170DRAFT_436083 [Aspergillus steynii IBT 23096]|uniref:Uncharacterized protein n=1 Tax=Aspergillus steynii IBT 23096 TaxID=1392250 RepID=A0A2I2GDQ8_9EURO|nr:uncharacterized protein P170DRAFT_436083 [Aspergillus steynii IBT 23096]PLB51002.1 hypothetical protein P170DRAFT_436083 [Aspergillus steynii IBT 23096]
MQRLQMTRLVLCPPVGLIPFAVPQHEPPFLTQPPSQKLKPHKKKKEEKKKKKKTPAEIPTLTVPPVHCETGSTIIHHHTIPSLSSSPQNPIHPQTQTCIASHRIGIAHPYLVGRNNEPMIVPWFAERLDDLWRRFSPPGIGLPGLAGVPYII